LRVLIATDYYPPFIGGGQIQSRLLARSLRDRGHEVVVATVAQPGLPGIEDDEGVPVYRLPHLRSRFRGHVAPAQSHHPPFPDPVAIVSLRKLLRSSRPDAVHAYGWIGYSCAVALAGSRIPLVLVARDYGYGCANRTLLRDEQVCEGPALAKCLACAGRNYGRPKGWLAALGVLGSRGLLRRQVAALHSVSAYVEETVRRDLWCGRPPQIPSQVIPDPVTASPKPEEGAERVSTVLAQLPDEPFILFVGALRRVKGVSELLTAYRQLDSPPPLVLIGTMEPDTPALPDGVHVILDAPHRAVLEAWPGSLFGVFPSIFPEPFGTVVAEAMSRGKAVIGTAPSGHSDLIEPGVTGLLVPPGNVEALVVAMRTLISKPELRESLGRAAARRAQRFTSERTLPQLERTLVALTAKY